ncbi:MULTISPECIES: SDR family NAD(P)-dependent oxidoreductase [Paraburkholderia]|uniref:3-oxoacyl-[acyl-carrier protein] reductase n=1 Tax=Paraburkholderia megapolitana TaxID=420953 RepID=A0A1I3KIS3_9BURK|nr:MULTISPECIES: SDR family oxidoreductase [Paraburkholderia]MCX4163539.1 SDR family oxidoreductase [Paraburkholderia megapolitana]MDN7159034.1 SDR family oxidoreductase [Paraburkholderia sp. CHISQ3]MDQ6496081.1 SDR family oxidoreductase [Paraburkholderia megapolitana]SFI72383.1 3-oxoacyl-[acyl-carrier protein] reductase [Paraburkholderia megapolitana]
MKKLEGKVALVTGSGRGIGREIALKLAADGARVVVNDLDATFAGETVAAIRDAGSDAFACMGSVTDADFGERFVRSAVDTFGGVDIIVNNAGYTWDSVIQKMTDEQWYAMIDVHMTAPFRILRAAADFIRQAAKKEADEGREVFRKVVNISSLAGVGGNTGQLGYGAAKAGVNGMTRVMAKEWGRFKVNVNSVAFGLIRTRLTEAAAGTGAIQIEGREIKVGVNPDVMKNMESGIPLGRGGTPEEAAGAVYLFCIPESNYISGQVVVCSGGFMF